MRGDGAGAAAGGGPRLPGRGGCLHRFRREKWPSCRREYKSEHVVEAISYRSLGRKLWTKENGKGVKQWRTRLGKDVNLGDGQYTRGWAAEGTELFIERIEGNK
jgi:hypothetical protein